MSIQRHNYENLGLPLGPYVHSVTHQNTLYTSGLTAFGTQAQSGTISDQARAIFAQLESIAKQQICKSQLRDKPRHTRMKL